MNCEHFEICGSCTLNLPYSEQILHKKEQICSLFSEFYKGEFEFFSSPEQNYRSRAEFGLYHDGDELNFAMNSLDKEKVIIKNCHIIEPKIANLMNEILPKIKESRNLKNKIFGIEFVASKLDLMAILLYHKDIFEIKNDLENLANLLKIKLIARSRGKKLVFGGENLCDEFEIEGKIYRYTYEATAFSQPNRSVNEKMISWAKSCVRDGRDFLEMYCGHGNFTIPLSENFKSVLATEISKNSIKNALKNCEINGVKNIKFVRISSEDLMSAFKNEREFRRLKEQNINLNEFDFSHILVDPPRAGLDESVLKFIKNYENIIYISCNPQTLYQNLQSLCDTHKIAKFAIFDQFAHTEHIECGVLLERIKK
ncbi:MULTISPECIES: tRNA (uridine(54)-C5)-methyltransferase TrmA [unclassified Campylobacter]|uniref:tRNA (uridine(54)-C5)-methyltransferase TrmA n=1 Tax=unclassified Campylobacter TaxID=2593542 RepID=UPI0022E9F655|nr:MULTISPECIES: tRNA (uridine(54)-C5)-methyltransferase TrmA [unclassified Campylobacter]MDA3079911.1 tRNA (uridine(54)-C5)-methyltransferase TrmA [Campylobacter sp. CS_NA2]MDA3086012.1 tRNA (uridine(54)-C5)-methyltransferase TrmA [Campylobacter sp. CS_ED1]MDA3090745.1 tRNA (uridine(54)-C5)-methyltransferase TrmA [Campylobacter sp. CS_ED2]WBR51968.1 tRNA (uridine(54)-C5)-methyltransferase TrmA [Campylobacter sp. CS_NA3]